MSDSSDSEQIQLIRYYQAELNRLEPPGTFRQQVLCTLYQHLIDTAARCDSPDSSSTDED